MSSIPGEKSSQQPPLSVNSDSVAAADDTRVFSWKRVLKGLGFGLSVCWLLLFVGGGAVDPSHVPLQGKVVSTVITIAAVFPVLLVLHGRFRYVVAALLLFAITWTLWNYWIHVEHI
jgi:hypothetical protein